MLVERLLPTARASLVTIADDAPLVEAAKLLRSGTDIVVACGQGGRVTGVITKTDVVGQIVHCQGAGCVASISLFMRRDVVLCVPGDRLSAVWALMKERGLKNIPITDPDLRPLGVLNARDALEGLLEEAVDEEALLRDYVMGIGYR